MITKLILNIEYLLLQLYRDITTIIKWIFSDIGDNLFSKKNYRKKKVISLSKIHSQNKESNTLDPILNKAMFSSKTTFRSVIADITDIKLGMKALTSSFDGEDCKCDLCVSPEQARWPELIGKAFLYGKYIIKHVRPDLEVQMIRENKPMNADYRPDRVRIIVDKKHIIQYAPRVG